MMAVHNEIEPGTTTIFLLFYTSTKFSMFNIRMFRTYSNHESNRTHIFINWLENSPKSMNSLGSLTQSHFCVNFNFNYRNENAVKDYPKIISTVFTNTMAMPERNCSRFIRWLWCASIHFHTFSRFSNSVEIVFVQLQSFAKKFTTKPTVTGQNDGFPSRVLANKFTCVTIGYFRSHLLFTIFRV